MVKLELVPGRKGPNDKLILVTAYGEPLSFSDLLFILKHYFESENSYYPKEKGYLGSTMLLEAIVEVCQGIPLDSVLKKFKLDRKIKKTLVIEKLHEVLT